MKLTFAHIANIFPEEFHQEIFDTFSDCKIFINTYSIENKLNYLDISRIAIDILDTDYYNGSFKHKHSLTIFNTLSIKLNTLQESLSKHNAQFYLVMNKIIQAKSYLSVSTFIIYHMLMEYYIPHLSFNKWRKYLN